MSESPASKLKILKIIIAILTFKLSPRKIRRLIKLAKIVDEVNRGELNLSHLLEISKEDLTTALWFMERYTTYPKIGFSLGLKLLGR